LHQGDNFKTNELPKKIQKSKTNKSNHHSSPFSDYSKILVGLGSTEMPWLLTTNMEIIDLSSDTSVCPDFPSFPDELGMIPVGGLDYQNAPTICGGLSPIQQMNDKCHKFVNGSWTTSDPLTTYRCCGQSSFNPENSQDGRIFLGAGFSNLVSLEN